MDENLKKLIQDEYGFEINSVSKAPRQFVAETFIIEIADKVKYFCKIITKPLFIPSVIKSLPALQVLHQSGLDRINYPIPTTNGELYVYKENTLVVLFNYISAPQSYDFDFRSFGTLLATVHKLSVDPSVSVPRDCFEFQYAGRFELELQGILQYSGNDSIKQSLRTLLQKYESEIKLDYSKFLKLSDKLKSQNHTFVITHGDSVGNTLVKSPTDLYLIDWDNILLSCPERDTWFCQDKPDFILGYQSIFPNYQVDEQLSHYFTYNRYFEDLIEYFAEVNGDYSSEHRQKNLEALENECLEGWLRPAIRKFD